ncbi:MAG: DUF1800 domain-containing protein [Planctomycetes bacterium]|nr:DUF1800 domain-containing protein [Planctomycetota bacterium]
MSDPLAPFEPSARDPFDLAKVGHLLRRAGFAASLQTRRELVRAGLSAAIDHVAPPLGRVAPADALLQEAIAFGDIERVRAFRVWLALQSVHPLRERTSCFWHGHFATSNQKVLDPRAMALQMATFDRLGLGTFDELLLAMCRDPALLRWLDNDVNTARQPNENFARELFELFSLGRGNYSEQDVRQAARAFTGWHVRDGVFHFQPHLHDDGDKQLFGADGAFDGGDVVAAVVRRPESAQFLARRWLRFFVHPEPDDADVTALAACYEQSGRDIGTTLVRLLRSRLFFSAAAYRCKVKSPADFVVGTVRLLGASAAPASLAATMASLGETWLEPPSVEGWHGERAWLSPAAWLLRSNFVADLLAGRHGRLRPHPAVWFRGLDRPADRARAAALLLLDGELDEPGRAGLLAVAQAQAGADAATAAAAILHAAACLPEYQLC